MLYMYSILIINDHNYNNFSYDSHLACGKEGISIMMTAIQFWGHNCRCMFHHALFPKTFHSFFVCSSKSEARDK